MGGGGIDLGGGYIFSGEADVGCVGPMFVIMIVFCWFLDLIFGTIEEKVRDRARSLAGRRSPAPPAPVRQAAPDQPSLRRRSPAQPTSAWCTRSTRS